MSNFAKVLGFFMISIFLVAIPFLTGLRVRDAMAGGEVDFITVCGVMISLGEMLCFLNLFLSRDE